MKIVVFAGTSEGKKAANLLAEKDYELYVTVATEYGKDIFEEDLLSKNISLLEGRLSAEQMSQLVSRCDMVVDATHPFAVEVSKNILSACEKEQKPYLRIVRDNQNAKQYEDLIIWAENQEQAIEIMNKTDEKVLLTTGSKDLPKYTKVKNYKERLFPRILPDIVSLEIAMQNEYKKKNIICMQGPFTHEVNAGMLDMTGAKLLLTKETGESGGYIEKLSACRETNAKAIVIKKPKEEIEKQNPAIQTQKMTADELERFIADFCSDKKSFDFADIQRFKEKISSEENICEKEKICFDNEKKGKNILEFADRNFENISDKTFNENTYKINLSYSSRSSVAKSEGFLPNTELEIGEQSEVTVPKTYFGKNSDNNTSSKAKSGKLSAEEYFSIEQSEVTVPKTDFNTNLRFPIFIDLKDKSVTIIGSGNIARRRIKSLLRYGARVRVVSPNAGSNLEMAGILDFESEQNPMYNGSVEVINRKYEQGDLENSVLVVSATDDREVNHKVYLEAKSRGIFVSVADKKEECTYYFPATWQGDGLSVGIVSDGADHSYVKKSSDIIRRMLDDIDFKGIRGNDEQN